MSDLRPCPFCGKSPESDPLPSGKVCCPAHTLYIRPDEWNTRAEPEPLMCANPGCDGGVALLGNFCGPNCARNVQRGQRALELLRKINNKFNLYDDDEDLLGQAKALLEKP